MKYQMWVHSVELQSNCYQGDTFQIKTSKWDLYSGLLSWTRSDNPIFVDIIVCWKANVSKCHLTWNQINIEYK